MGLIQKFFDLMTPKTGVPAIIEVEGEAFNPTLELIKMLKEKIADKCSRIVDMEFEIGRLRSENASLRAKIESQPSIVPETKKHFITTNALKSELERRSREEKEKQDKLYAKKDSH